MSTLSNEYVLSAIKNQFGNSITAADEPNGLLTVTVAHESYFDLVKWLKEHPELNFFFLTDLTGVNYPDHKGEELGVVVHLHNLQRNFRLRIKTFFTVDHPHIKSLTSLFHGANWMERETFDFFGVHFNGHPNLKRILNVDEMTYHPLLKKYPLEDQTREDKNNKYFGR